MTEATPEARKIIDEAIMATENYFGATSPKRAGHIRIYAEQIDQLHEGLQAQVRGLKMLSEAQSKITNKIEAERDKLRKALELIAAYQGRTLIAADHHEIYQRAYSLGAHEAFGQVAGIAADALATPCHSDADAAPGGAS